MITLPRKKNILSAEISCASTAEVLDHIVTLAKDRVSSYVCLANVHMVIEAYQDLSFREILSQSDIAAPDGKPLSLFMNRLYGTQQEQVAGPDLMIALFDRAEQENLSIFVYGSTPEVLEAMQEKLQKNHPTLRIAGMMSPPFRPLSTEEDEAITREIEGSGAHIVLVGLGCPKQERWMHAHRKQISAVMLGVGAAFPFYTGHLKRCPRWMRQLALEWLFRLLSEPRRLFKRYFYTNTLFLILILAQMAQQSFQRCTKSA